MSNDLADMNYESFQAIVMSKDNKSNHEVNNIIIIYLEKIRS